MKRPSSIEDQPPPKKSKGFTTKKKAGRLSVQKATPSGQGKGDQSNLLSVGKPLKVDDSSTIIPFMGEVNPASTLLIVKQSDATDNFENKHEMADETKEQPNTTVKEGSAYCGHVAQLVAQMPPAFRSAYLTLGKLYQSNVVQALRVSGLPMSPSNKLVEVILIKNINSFILSDKGKGPTAAAPVAPEADSEDESPAAFAKMKKVEREKLKQDLFKCYPEAYINGVRGASSWHVGYMSQFAAEVHVVGHLSFNTQR